jgi:hypothetical protein
MRTNPKKCKQCKYYKNNPAQDPCFSCFDSDNFKITNEAYLENIIGTSQEKWEKWAKKMNCFDGRMCYCAPFEEKEDIEDEDSILVER